MEAFRAEVRGWLDAHAPGQGQPRRLLVDPHRRRPHDGRVPPARARGLRPDVRVAAPALRGRVRPALVAGGLRRARRTARGRTTWSSRSRLATACRRRCSRSRWRCSRPVLFTHGTHEQRVDAPAQGRAGGGELVPAPVRARRRLRPRQRGDTERTPVDGGWEVTGQKVWTSGAGSSDFALLIARSDPDVPGRAGLSCFGIEMRQPGVEVRPLRQMSGGFHFSEVFLDRAFVPATALIGEPGGGFAVLRTMLASERAAIGGGTSARSAAALVALADAMGRAADPTVRQVVASAVTRERILDLVQQRVAAGAAIPGGGFGREAALLRARPALCHGGHRGARGSSHGGRAATPRRGSSGSCSPRGCASVVAPTRSSGTPSPSKGWACRGNHGQRRERSPDERHRRHDDRVRDRPGSDVRSHAEAAAPRRGVPRVVRRCPPPTCSTTSPPTTSPIRSP